MISPNVFTEIKRLIFFFFFFGKSKGTSLIFGRLILEIENGKNSLKYQLQALIKLFKRTFAPIKRYIRFKHKSLDDTISLSMLKITV